MRSNAWTHLSLGIAMAALLTGMAATAQNSFDKAPIPPPVSHSQPLSTAKAKPPCPASRADRWGGCRGKDYNGPIGDWGDPEYGDRLGRIDVYSSTEQSGSELAEPIP
ncbi:hypothetical protein [Nevskia sp.]|uniref:hypothetical protein n=1 Tax=Nevskia sp. TaxID=1929292 RepID=UPI0025F3C156|nr:hypothetical protein [Nevskia sp.]